MKLATLHKRFIKGTEKEGVVILKTTLLCNITNVVVKALGLSGPKVYLTTRMLKHLYDAKPAEEYEFILNNIILIVRYPDQIYQNKEGKRGNFCFVKLIKKNEYFCSIEESLQVTSEGKTEEMNFIITVFLIRGKGYLKDYKLLWDRKGGSPSS